MKLGLVSVSMPIIGNCSRYFVALSASATVEMVIMRPSKCSVGILSMAFLSMLA